MTLAPAIMLKGKEEMGLAAVPSNAATLNKAIPTTDGDGLCVRHPRWRKEVTDPAFSHL